MQTCTLSPSDKKAYARDVGKILVRKYGKKKFYKPEQVRRASKETNYDIDWHCWAMCIYAPPLDFKRYHDSIGESCDYASMKSEMASAITDGASESWFDIDLSWLDWPDFDLPSIFDVFN